MNIISNKSSVQSVFHAARDKSISHRSLILASLASESSYIKNILWGEDVQSTAIILQTLGCRIRITDRNDSTATVNIELDPSNFRLEKPSNSILDCGNSGTTMRLMTGLLCNSTYPFTLVGDVSLSKRPMRRVIEPLQKLGYGYSCSDPNHRSPILFEPSTMEKIEFFTYDMHVASAQVKSALLLCGLQNNGCRITGGKNSRNHTEIMLEHLGANIQYPHHSPFIDIQNEFQGDTIEIKGTSYLKGLDCSVPVDQSSVAFVITAALICPNSRIVVNNVNMNSTRTGFLEHVLKMGANIEIEMHSNDEYIEPTARLIISYTPDLKNINIVPDDLPRLIDEVPILALLATQAEGSFVLSDAFELRVKETDRIKATVKNLQILGIEIFEQENGFSLIGKQNITGGEVSCYHDHRIAMMSVIAGFVSKESVLVRDVECIETSFPNFFREFVRCGANITIG